MLTPAFHFRILENFLPVFNEHARIFTRVLAQHEGHGAVDIVPPSTMATLDIICGIIIIVDLNIYIYKDKLIIFNSFFFL